MIGVEQMNTSQNPPTTANPTPPPPPSTLQPVTSVQRIESLDVLRGFALLGILVVNSLLFALPMFEGMMPPFTSIRGEESAPGDWAAWWIVSVFFQFKFITIFSLLFGMGAAIQFDRTRAAGKNFNWFFIKRMFVLLCFGLIHALAFWYGDILALYAVIGAWLLLLCRLRQKTLIQISILCLCVAAALSGGLTLLEQFAPENPAGQAASTEMPETAFEAMGQAMFEPNSEIWLLAEERAYSEGPYLDLFAFRVISWLMSFIFAGFSFGWHILAMFALGVATIRSGFFGGVGGRLRSYAITIALPVGLTIEILCALALALGAEEHIWVRALVTAIHEFSVPLVSLGYMGLVTAIVKSGVFSWAMHMIACVGRMALTIYLLETIIMTSIFYYYGLGLFGDVDRIWLLVMSLGIWAGLAVFSTAWLSVFSRGPLEWIWRVLTYGRAPKSG